MKQVMGMLAGGIRRRRVIAGAAALLALALLLSACGGDDPAETVDQGAELLRVEFDEPGAWETGIFPPDADQPDSVLAIDDGRYLIEHQAPRAASFVWGAGGDPYQDVMIEVDSEQLGSYDNNLYGVACRLQTDENGDTSGYVLLISGDAHFGIARLENSSLNFVLDWHQSAEINAGRSSNTLRGVCAEDYLALYANGEFLGDVKDDTFSRAGQVGLIAGVNRGETVDVAFDDLVVYAATVED